MRFISFSILFSVFAILFHGVVAPNPIAPNPIAPNLIALRHKLATESLKKSWRFHLQARVSSGDEKIAQLAESHKQYTLGYLGKKQSPEFHIARAAEHRDNSRHALEMAKNAKSEEERKKWTAQAIESLHRAENRMLALKAQHGPR
jgi:hypothetical protein